MTGPSYYFQDKVKVIDHMTYSGYLFGHVIYYFQMKVIIREWKELGIYHKFPCCALGVQLSFLIDYLLRTCTNGTDRSDGLLSLDLGPGSVPGHVIYAFYQKLPLISFYIIDHMFLIISNMDTCFLLMPNISMYPLLPFLTFKYVYMLSCR